MGLLTNPRAEETNKLIVLLKKHDAKIAVVAYIAGLIWLVFQANAKYNLGKFAIRYTIGIIIITNCTPKL